MTNILSQTETKKNIAKYYTVGFNLPTVNCENTT